MPEVILPGTYITVRDEGLITAGRVVTGNIGIVGTATKGLTNEVQIIGSFTEAQEVFGDADDSVTLIRTLEHVFNNGGRTVYAVRTAAATPLATQYSFKAAAADVTAALILEAKSPGTWGNAIQISIAQTDPVITFQEKLAGSAAGLGHGNIDKDSTVNSIVVQQKATGLSLTYKIIYTGTADPLKEEVLIKPEDGKLTFTTLASHVPTAADTILARYETKPTDNRKIEFLSGNIKETYLVADAAHLAEQVDRRSGLLKKVQVNAGGKILSVFTNTRAGTNGENAVATDYRTSLAKLESDIINIVLLAGQDATNSAMMTALAGHINITTENKRERMAIVGCNGDSEISAVANHNFDSDRIVYVGPGIRISSTETLTGAYTAAAIAGLLSSLPVQSSPTNKVLTLPNLAAEYSSSKLEKLVTNRVLAVEKRNGFRVVKGITTATNSAWHQITTRRIVDYAIYGVRSSCNPYIGKLNNERVRGAMKATLDAFLTRMVDDEALVSYDLTVTANRAQEIAGEAIVIMTVRPTFSIDFIRVTMYLG
jgi:hypothetical protein